MRIFGVSDLHVDYPQNIKLLKNICASQNFSEDILIIAGDISHKLDLVKEVFTILKQSFMEVFAVPGNHDLWTSTEETKQHFTSYTKLLNFISLCKACDVRTQPSTINGITIFPLYSWYDDSFSTEEDNLYFSEELLYNWSDFFNFKWPIDPNTGKASPINLSDNVNQTLYPPSLNNKFDVKTKLKQSGDIAQVFLQINTKNIQEFKSLSDFSAHGTSAHPLITFSHFIPRRELLPPITFLYFKSLPKVAGCSDLDTQIRDLGSSIHLFGHSHINGDTNINGVRYIQWKLGYPREHLSNFNFKLIYEKKNN